jgi:tetratricopeptide (TPR) repeat protein
MLLPSLPDLQPYLTLIGTVLSVATLGFVLNLAKLMADAAKAKAEVMEERLKKSAEEASRVEKWAERQKVEMQSEVTKLREQLTMAGVNSTLDANDAVARISRELKDSLELRINELSATVSKQNGDSEDPDASLQLGRGYMATGHWAFAAKYLEIYLRRTPTDFEAQFSRGVAYLNTRDGLNTNLAALRAFNEAIAFAPMDSLIAAKEPVSARLFIYRGTALKRLGRLEEAGKDLQIGLQRATADYERADGTYNLACVLAMQGAKERLLATLREARYLKRKAYVAQNATAHLEDYFKNFATDPDVLTLLGELTCAREV